MNKLIFGTFLAGVFAASPVQSAFVYDWFITNPVQTVHPFQTVLLNATIVNDPTGDPLNLDVEVSQANAFFNPSPGASPYDIVFGPSKINILSQFDGVTLDPGESLDFVFSTWLPDPGPVPAGLYAAFSLGLIIDGVDDTWQVEVPNPNFNTSLCNALGTPLYCDLTALRDGVVLITVEAVPLPGGLLLGASGLGALMLRMRRRR